jgi:very-short-patch-repair endonuclease
MPKRTPRRWRAPKKVQEAARRLRREMTPAELKLWGRLRDRQVNDAYFRAQHAVDRFILDFICVKARLVIEIDGDTHADPNQSAHDAERTAWLSTQRRYRVIRFDNKEVHQNLETVIETIRAAL